jgi:predicted dehydrogenase
MAVYNDLAPEERIRVHDKGVSCPSEEHDLTQPPTSYRYGDIIVPFVPTQEPLSVEDQHFVESVLAGSVPRTDGRNGLAVVQVLEAAERSVAVGRPVHLDGSTQLLTMAGGREVV